MNSVYDNPISTPIPSSTLSPSLVPTTSITRNTHSNIIPITPSSDYANSLFTRYYLSQNMPTMMPIAEDTTEINTTSATSTSAIINSTLTTTSSSNSVLSSAITSKNNLMCSSTTMDVPSRSSSPSTLNNLDFSSDNSSINQTSSSTLVSFSSSSSTNENSEEEEEEEEKEEKKENEEKGKSFIDINFQDVEVISSPTILSMIKNSNSQEI
jgi:hypothetical protein